MPEDGGECLPTKDILTDDKIVRLCQVLGKNGVKKIKLTGGEPLIRPNLPELIQRIKSIPGIEQVTLTTNGVLLGEKIDELVKAGLDAVNVSIDHLDEKEYEKITRRNQLRTVLQGLEKAVQYDQLLVKINCVPIAAKEEQIVDLVKLAKNRKIHVRFIEVMPIGMGKHMESYSEEQIIEILERQIGKLNPYTEKLGNGPSHYYEIDGFLGKIGFISAISHKFCDECNRVRVTSEGYLKTCLQYDIGANLIPFLDEGKESELEMTIRKAIDIKPKSHKFHEEKEGKEEHRGMSQIGG